MYVWNITKFNKFIYLFTCHPLQKINKLSCLPMLLLTLAPLPSDCHWLTTIFVTDFILNLLSFVF